MKNKYITLIRLDNWIKNFLIFAPLFFGQELFNGNLLLRSIIAFVSFSLVTSGMYVVNDYFDIAEDQQHPIKKHRPLAAGSISKEDARLIATSCLVVGLGVGLLLSIDIFYILLLYIGLNAWYNMSLKHLTIIDVCMVSIMYVIRLVVGSAATGIGLSMWIILLTFFMALFISFAKRRDDVLYLADGMKTRKSANGYNLEYLNIAMMLTSSIVVVSYIMFTVAPAEIAKVHTENLYLTSIFVVLAILRYMQVILVEGRHGSPIRIFIEDRFIQCTVLGWIILSGIFFYL